MEKTRLHFQVAEDRIASTVIHVCLPIDNATMAVSLSIEYHKAFLFIEVRMPTVVLLSDLFFVQEHPSDPYRGVDIPPTVMYHIAHNATLSKVSLIRLDTTVFN